MDKSGSGLYDVVRLGTENGNEVNFGPSDENTRFQAQVYSRPEAVDEVTGTASPVDLKTTRFSANIVEVVQTPSTVWHAGCLHRGSRAVYAASGAEWLPTFLTWSNRLFTFSNLNDPANPLTPLLENDIETLSFDEFIEIDDDRSDHDSRIVGSSSGEDLTVWMLHLLLKRHLQSKGLIVDTRRRRAYFPRSPVGPRKVTYQARIRRATRTVVKARGNRKDGQPSYWEHSSLGYRFERFGNAWALVIVPGYVFTYNGRRGLLKSERVNRLSTRRASRDYNSTVQHDLVFWLWVLSGGYQDAYGLYDGPAPDPLSDSFAPGDDPNVVISHGSDAGGLDDESFDDDGLSILGPSESEAEFSFNPVSVRLRSELATASVHEATLSSGAEGEAVDEEDIGLILSQEAEMERQAADASEDQSA